MDAFDWNKEYTRGELEAAFSAAGIDISTHTDILDKLFAENDHYKFTSNPYSHYGFSPELVSESYEKASDILTDVEAVYGDKLTDRERQRYDTLANAFLLDAKYTEKTWEEFMRYIDEQVAAGNEAAVLAKSQYEAYEANKKHQYYQSIDWSKLMAGTDLTGTNQVMMEALAK